MVQPKLTNLLNLQKTNKSHKCFMNTNVRQRRLNDNHLSILAIAVGCRYQSRKVDVKTTSLSNNLLALETKNNTVGTVASSALSRQYGSHPYINSAGHLLFASCQLPVATCHLPLAKLPVAKLQVARPPFLLP